MSYTVRHLGSGPNGWRVELVFADGTKLYGVHADGYTAAVDAVIQRLEFYPTPAAYAARLAVS